MEGDLFALLLHSKSAEISIHALRVEGDILRLLLSSCTAYFYPRPPGGGRQPMIANAGRTPKISIHALRVEGDSMPDAFSLLKSTISIHALRVEGD